MEQTIGIDTIRPALAAELRACRILLPGVFGPHTAPDRLLVALGGDGALVGAAACAWRLVRRAPGFPVMVAVIPPMRRRGVGRALLAALAADVAGETAALRGWGPLPAESVAAAFLRGCGFAQHHQVVTFEAELAGVARLEVAATGLLARLRAGGRMPVDARAVTPGAALAPDIAVLAAREHPGIGAETMARLEAGGFGRHDPALSVAVLQGGQVVAASLAHAAEGAVRIDMAAVYPGWRNGWAGVLLVAEMAERARASGLTRCRFTCDSRLRGAIKLGGRAAARVVAESAVFTREL